MFKDRSHTGACRPLTCSHNPRSASTGSRWYCNCVKHHSERTPHKKYITFLPGGTTCFGRIHNARMVCQFQGSITLFSGGNTRDPTHAELYRGPQSCSELNYTTQAIICLMELIIARLSLLFSVYVTVFSQDCVSLGRTTSKQLEEKVYKMSVRLMFVCMWWMCLFFLE